MASILHKRVTLLTDAVFNRIYRFTFLVSLRFQLTSMKGMENKKLLCNKNKLKDYMIYLGIGNFIIFVLWPSFLYMHLFCAHKCCGCEKQHSKL